MGGQEQQGWGLARMGNVAAQLPEEGGVPTAPAEPEWHIALAQLGSSQQRRRSRAAHLPGACSRGPRPKNLTD